MVKMTDTLVAVFAMHGMVGHLRITNPALFGFFILRNRSLPQRLGVSIVDCIDSIQEIGLFSNLPISLINQCSGQVHIHGIDSNGSHAKIQDQPHE